MEVYTLLHLHHVIAVVVESWKTVVAFRWTGPGPHYLDQVEYHGRHHHHHHHHGYQ